MRAYIGPLILSFALGCGREGDEDTDGRTETKVVTADCKAGKDGVDGIAGEAGTDGEDGASGPKGDQGPSGPQGEPGLDGSDCRILRELVYNKDGDLRENRCDVYLECREDVVFISRVREACE